MSGGLRNGCKEDWAAGETDFIQRIWCSSVYSAFESKLLCGIWTNSNGAKVINGVLDVRKAMGP
jgi:hypothetical protein